MGASEAPDVDRLQSAGPAVVPELETAEFPDGGGEILRGTEPGAGEGGRRFCNLDGRRDPGGTKGIRLLGKGPGSG